MERHVSLPLWIIAAVVVCALAIGAASAPAFAGGNPNVKAAIHIKAHPTSCTKGYPTFATCSSIATTWAGTGDIDAMPVFYDLVGYVAVGFGLDWPAEWGSTSWVKCRGDLAVGTIKDPGDGTGITWTTCQSSWSVSPGAAWLAATGSGRVEIVPDPATGDLGVVDCAPSPGPYLDRCVAAYGAGIGGASGDDPCVVPIVSLTLAKTDNIGSGCVFPEGSFTYALAYTNPNSSAVNNVVLTDSLPADVDYVSSTGGGVYNSGSHTVVWSLGTVAGSGSGSVFVDVTVDSAVAPDAGLVNNCWIVSTETPVPTTATLTTRVCACQIDGVDTVCPGSKVQFCAPTGMTSYAWSVTGNGTVFGAASQRCVTIWAGTTCDQTYTIDLTVVDPYGITSQCSKDVMVEDGEAPVITGCPADVQVQCLSQVPAPNIAAVTYTDNCSNVTVTHQGDVQSGTCVGPDVITITRTYRATDRCGLYDECVQTITVDDTTPPTFTTLPGGDSLGCVTEVPAADIGLVAASDNCGGSPTITWQGDQVTGTACNGTVERTYRATDDCGNYADSVQIFFIQDSTDPAFTSQCPADTSVECDQVPAAATMTAADGCDTSVDVEFEEQRTDGVCPNEYTLVRIWTAIDDCGNDAKCFQTITVADATWPTITVFPGDENLQCLAELPAPNTALVEGTDNCGAVTVSWVEDVVTGTSCSGTVERVYRVVDPCSRNVDSVQTFTILDTTDPYFTSQCPADATVECNLVPTPPTMTAADNCDSDVAVTFQEQRTDGACPAAYTLVRTWTATDDCTNDVECVQTITVRDTTAPVLTPAADERVACGEPIVFTNPMAADNCDYDVQLNDLGETSTPGPGAGEVTHTKCWTGIDDCGNISAQCCQNIIEDTCEYLPLTLAKTDNSSDCFYAGDSITYTIGYGNPNAIEVTSVVLTDEIPSGTNYVSSTGGGVWNAGNGTVTWTLGALAGSGSGEVDLTVEIQGAVAPGTTLGNDCEIASAETSPTSRHVDTPVCACLITGPTAVCPYKAYEFCGPDGMTSYDWTISGDGTITSARDIQCVRVEAGPGPAQLAGSQGVPSCEYDYILQLTAGEPLGGTSECQLAVQGRDDTAPEITCPPSVNFECSAIGDAGTATATDSCDDSPQINYADNIVPGAGPGCYVIERTWTASDDCGNAAQCVQNIVILDSTPPEITCAPDASIGCNEPLVFTDPTATDLCDADPEIAVVSTETVWVPTTRELRYTRCWEASDGCGNTDQCCQTITREACAFVPLRITKDDGLTAPAAPGDTITYAITVYNDNSVEVTSVVVVDELPASADFISATGAHIHDTSDHDVVWEIPTIASSSSAVVTLAVEVDAQMVSGDIVNMASASCPQILGSVETTETTPVVSPKQGVYLDIKPGFCPNPLNPKGTGQVAVAVLGTADLDVTDIDVSSLALGREGVAATVGPVSSSIADVAAPFTGDLCGCTTAGADGYPDLVLRFSNTALFTSLGLNDVKGRYVEMILTGALTSGTEIVGRDCARIMGKSENQGLGILMSASRETGFVAGAQIGMAGGEIDLAFTLAEPGHVQVDIFDVQGRLVRRLVDADLDAGDHSAAWSVTDSSGRRVPMGIYFARLSTAEMHTTKKLVVIE
jgi:uncharacterized repeat protein (TIGR01451 family)